MHTPRLCIDGRAASEFPSSGFVAEELIDQLVATQGMETELTCDWMEKRRTVLLAHPTQVFSGQLRRHETRKRIGFSPLTWLWEKSFLRRAGVSAFHRFRPANRLLASPGCPTITTVLPPRGASLGRARLKRDQSFVVPSQADAERLEKKRGVDREQIHVVYPSVRRYTAFTSFTSSGDKGLCLFLRDAGEALDIGKTSKVASRLFENARQKTIRLGKRSEVAPTAWVKTLKETSVVFYLSAKPFDWPVLAIEALFLGIPVFFLDGNAVLEEILPKSLSLSRLLIDPLTPARLKQVIAEARQKLNELGLFDPLYSAKRYREIYNSLEVKFE